MHGFMGAAGRVHIIQLVHGDDLLDGILQYLQQNCIQNAVVLAGLGTLETCNVHSVVTTTFPVENRYIEFPAQPLGVSAVNGFIANGQPHIHMVFSTYTGQAATFTGHLESGSKVLCRMEIMLLEVGGIELERQFDENGVEILIDKKGR